jgi:hypothetical protein
MHLSRHRSDSAGQLAHYFNGLSKLRRGDQLRSSTDVIRHTARVERAAPIAGLTSYQAVN